MRSVEHTELIATLDEMDHNWIWGSGLICAWMKDGSGFGLVALGEHDAATCWLVANSGFRLGADNIVWIGSGYDGDDQLAGKRVIVYLAVSKTETTYARRTVSITDTGKVIPVGDLEFREPSGWLPMVSLDAAHPVKEWPLGDQLALLRKLGHMVEVRA